MPVTFDNAASAYSIGTAITVALTAAANTVLLAFVGTINAGVSVSSVAYAGVTMTRLGKAGGGANFEVWGLTAPASGNNNLVFQATGAASNWMIHGLTYLNVAGTNPFGEVASATATGAVTTNLSVSSSTTNLVVASFRVNSAVIPVNNNGTSRLGFSGGAVMGMRTVDVTGAAPITVSATASVSTNWLMLGIPLVFSAAAVGGTTPLWRSLMGVGY